MPLKKLTLKPGINRENTRYTNEMGWYEGDKIRFRQGSPEKIGGWRRISNSTFLGICRSMQAWPLLNGTVVRGIGTHLKFYLERGGDYFDITPIRATETLSDPFETTNGSTTVVVTDAAGGFADGDFVTFSGASAVGGLTIDGEYQIALLTASTYSIEASSAATSSATGGGTVTAAYQIGVGSEFSGAFSGWGAGTWGAGAWGTGEPSENLVTPLRIWNQSDFGEDLVYGPSGKGLYYWDASGGVTARGVALSSLGGASDVPVVHKLLVVSDISRFVFVLGCNDLGNTTFDPLLIRWSDQENAVNWTPAATNQAGSIRLSRGSNIVAAKQARQELLVWTDFSLYSLQYVGAPIVWQAQIVGENISVASQNCVAYANGVAYWMGRSRFYKYDGRSQSLRCDLRRYVFEDFNKSQYEQVFGGTNEAFHEIWWFYCSSDSDRLNRYVVYNYLYDIWYYGSMERTAWLETSFDGFPYAATYSHNVVQHELGINDEELSTPQPIEAFVTSAEFDIDDGHRFGFVWRVIPDVTFEGSESGSPHVVMELLPLRGSGSGYSNPESLGGVNQQNVIRSVALPVEQYTNQINTRVRGRQMSIKISSSDLDVSWQLGSPRIDIRPDGRR